MEETLDLSKGEFLANGSLPSSKWKAEALVKLKKQHFHQKDQEKTKLLTRKRNWSANYLYGKLGFSTVRNKIEPVLPLEKVRVP